VRWGVVLAALLLSGPVWSITLPTLPKAVLLPKDGSAPIPIPTASSVGALLPRLTLPGLAMGAIQLCVAARCWNQIPGLAPDLPAPVKPTTWAGPDSPPAVGTMEYYCVGCNQPVSAGSLEAYGAAIASYKCGGSGVDYVTVSPSVITFKCIGGSPNNDPFGGAFNTRCASGYSLSNEQCNLSNPSVVKWPPDTRPSVGPNSAKTGFEFYLRDADRFNLPSDPFASIAFPSNSVNLQGSDEFGNPQTMDIVPTPGGGSQITIQTQGADPVTGTTDVAKHSITFDTNGNVVTNTYNYYTNTTITELEQNPPVQTNILFPDDYNRELTQQQILDELKKPPALPPPPDPVPNLGIQDTPIPVETINLPQVTDEGERFAAGCPAPAGFSALGHEFSISMSPFCQVATQIAPFFVGAAWLLAARIVGGGLS
jgi:hypothetical protein